MKLGIVFESLPIKWQAYSSQTMTGIVEEREPAPRRKATYRGDKRHVMEGGQESWVGPDRRGILWRPCHTDYDAEKDSTVVIFAPISPHEIKQVPGLTERLQQLQMNQAMAMGATAGIGGM